MPIGGNVISIPVIPLSVKAVRGIQAERDVIGSLKVVFPSSVVKYNTFRSSMDFGAFDIAGSSVLCRKIQQCRILQHILRSQVMFLHFLIKRGSINPQCPCRSGDITARRFECFDNGSPFSFLKRKNIGGIRRATCSRL